LQFVICKVRTWGVHDDLFTSQITNCKLQIGGLWLAASCLNIGSFSLPAGKYAAYVEAIGKPSLLNHMLGPVAFSR
jgi:hypothetical protein